MRIEDKDYHMERARSELDWAYRPERETVAEAHLRLSSLHMQRLRDLDESCGGATIGR
ncbi:MAG TPA: hypothetical protein VGB79_08810 [Allosphingosinicella sp.]|jgi:hypothetical protein